MDVNRYTLNPPSLEQIASVFEQALQQNYHESSVDVATCPDLRGPPFHLAHKGLGGHEVVADIGGQANLFPRPLLDKKYSMIDCAQMMGLPPKHGQLLGAGAGPFHVLGQNTELAANLSWTGGYTHVTNATRFIAVQGSTDNGRPKIVCRASPSTDCALMMNLYGSDGVTGPVLRVTAKGRKGQEKSFPEFLRQALQTAFGEDRQIAVGGVFVIKSGIAKFHVMPDFPSEEDLPFPDRSAVEEWLTFHHFKAPMVCLTVFHTADPRRLGLRMEHTHCFSADGKDEGGHYHYDLLPDETDSAGTEVEYEAYFNTATELVRIDQPRSI